jgi:hypothetical protein
MADRYTDCRSKLPRSYLAYVESHNGWEGDLGDELGYVVIWDCETIQERWDGYQMSQYLSEHWFPFGSDGGGEMFCFDLLSETDRVYSIPYIGMADDEAMLKCPSFEEIAGAIKRRTKPHDILEKNRRHKKGE